MHQEYEDVMKLLRCLIVLWKSLMIKVENIEGDALDFRKYIKKMKYKVKFVIKFNEIHDNNLGDLIIHHFFYGKALEINPITMFDWALQLNPNVTEQRC